MADHCSPPSGTGGDARRETLVVALRRFVSVYGWRAYALPLLVVATLLTALDVAGGPSPESSAAGPVRTSAATSPDVAATSSPTATPPSTGATATPAGESEPATTLTPPTVVQRGAGSLGVVPGGSDVLGTGGPTLRFRVELEDGIDADGAAFAEAVQVTLGDPRGWGADGRTRFQRVSDGNYDFRVLLVSPDNVNSFCPGLDTGGYTSCRSGDHAVINLARWLTGVPDYAGDLPTYRQYVVNHEVGHFLGHGHELCGGPGELAPVMQQQTLGLEGCLKNPWPHP